MTAKEWLGVIQNSSDYDHNMTPLIEKYGEMLLDEFKASKSILTKLPDSYIEKKALDIAGSVMEIDPNENIDRLIGVIEKGIASAILDSMHDSSIRRDAWIMILGEDGAPTSWKETLSDVKAE